MRKIFSYLKPHLAAMAFGLLIKVIGTFADLGLPYVLAHIMNQILPRERVSLIFLWGGFMLLLAFLARVFNILANRMAARTAKAATEKLRYDLFHKVMHLSGTQTDGLSVPSLVSRLTSDTYNIHQMIGMMQRLGVRAPMILLGGVVISISMEPFLSLVLLMVIPLLGAVVVFISKRGIPLFGSSQKSADSMVRVIREDISGIRVIKALSKTGYEKERFQKVNLELSRKETAASKTMASTGPVMNFLLNAGLAAVLILGAFRVDAGVTEAGTIIAFLTYFTMILYAVLMINRIFMIYSKASASAERISEVLALKEDLICEAPVYGGTEAYIVFEDVVFGYHKKKLERQAGAAAQNPMEAGAEKPCLNHISFQVKKGGSLGIIGATGSGKTTLLNLLMRFYDADQGQIYIDGRSIKSYPLQELRKLFGVVFQNDVIFSDSIYENISFGRDLAMEEVVQASENGQAADFIKEKPDTYAYVASIKGADFSGGQKQRLMIARAMADKPKILVFDDSSSALDYKTDAMLRKAIRENYGGSVIIMAAQRVSSILHMDTILVLEEGELIGAGSHDALMENCSVYKEIYQSQMGYAAV